MQGFEISFEVSPMLFLILGWYSTDESFCTFLNVDSNSSYRSCRKFSDLTPSSSLSKKICWMCYVYTWFFDLYFSKTLQRFTDSRPQGSIVIKRKGFEILNKYDIFQISFSNSYFQRKIIAILIKLLTSQLSYSYFQGDLVAVGVLSGNRNFEGRIHPLTRANYLASPLLVIAYAIAGTVMIDFETEPLGEWIFEVLSELF